MFYHAGETYENQTLVYDDNGSLVDATAIVITIRDPSGTVMVDAQAMTKIATGTYKYDAYDLPEIPVFGTWTAEVKTTDANDNYEIETESFYVVDNLYTTPQKVSGFMRLVDQTTQARLVFTDDTDPSLSDVESSIIQAMDRIDGETNHSWRAVRVTNEYYNIPCNISGVRHREYGIHLRHRKIHPFVSGTDKIEIWDGSNWVDLVEDYTEGRGEDFWVDYEQGVVYVVNRRPWALEKGIRASYRYGDDAVPGDITQACTKLVAIDLAETNDYVVTLPDGISEYSRGSKVDSWKRDIERIIDNRREIISV